MSEADTYQPLSPETIAERLGSLACMSEHVGGDPASWSVREIGDGNLNLVFIVTSPSGSVIVKQALPYVRLVGDSWPLPLYRAFFENCALERQAQRAPDAVPKVFHFDESQALIVMEHLTPHIILRNKLIAGEQISGAGEFVGNFCAQTAFRGSELSLASADKKRDVGLFSGNVAIPAITESLVFTDPYFDAELNNHNPLLNSLVAELRQDVTLKTAVQTALMKFASNTETMVHGDLHSGSIMATDSELKVIDPEFAQYGPMGFDLGMVSANFLMAYFSQPGHRGDNLATYQDWILNVMVASFDAFDAEFSRLWHSERTGMLYPKSLFEDQGQDSGEACSHVLANIHRDALVFCGIEMHRRCLSLAHNADFESIEDPAVRAPLEARNIAMGRELILNAENLAHCSAVIDMAKAHNVGDFL